MSVVEYTHEIPLITDPLGSGWQQSERAGIEITQTRAIMSRDAFEELREYSCTRPTGVYAGKMWKRFDGAFDRVYLAAGGKPEWMLCWYGHCQKPECPGVECKDYVSNHHRLIFIRRTVGGVVVDNDPVTDATLTAMQIPTDPDGEGGGHSTGYRGW